MTTHHDIIRLILSEAGRAGRQRVDVLKPLCEAFCAAYDHDHENENERPVDCEVLPDDETAHLYYVDCYYKAQAPELRAKPRDRVDPTASYLDVNPCEVSVPEWANHHRRLLRALAQDERRRHETNAA